MHRVEQLCQKTNQFNLTTKRYTAVDIATMYANKNTDVITFEIVDKFGSYGITGLTLINVESEKAVVDSLIFSCRVLSRGVEFAIWSFLTQYFHGHDIKVIEGEFINTRKNRQVTNYYEKVGFTCYKKYDNFKEYRASILDLPKNLAPYIKIEAVNFGE